VYQDFHSHFNKDFSANTNLINSQTCFSFHSKKDFLDFFNIFPDNHENIKVVLGVHPWYLDMNLLFFLESVLENENTKIYGIGEVGFDFIKGDFSKNKALQLEFFHYQLYLAEKYNLPLIIHNLKGFHELAKYVKQLKKIKACLFHGFSGSLQEAQFFLKQDVNAFFSFGENILFNRKKAIECVNKLPVNRLGFETDGKKHISIEKVFFKAKEIKNVTKEEDITIFHTEIKRNFNSIFT